MELFRELDVPTIKISKIIQCVSKWLHDKEMNKNYLPSTAAANNFVGIAQILGKCQLAVQIIQSESE